MSFYMDIHEPRIRQFAEFREIWDIDFPEEQLTDMMRKQEGG
jgi:hypothetical protein